MSNWNPNKLWHLETCHMGQNAALAEHWRKNPWSTIDIQCLFTDYDIEVILFSLFYSRI